MFVQSEKFVEAHGGQRTGVSIFGQELGSAINRPTRSFATSTPT
jgi:hypothetical protein